MKWFATLAAVLVPALVSAQTASQRGFADGSFFGFPQTAPNDAVRIVGDLLVREEAFLKPSDWLQLAGGVDLRANTHEQVDTAWTPDFSDRGVRRPRLAVRRLTATLTRGPLTVDAGKQFIRWGKADIVNPTDRFAPRDFLNVVDAEFLGVTGIRAVAQVRDETFEAVWVPHFTPSRVPLLDQRWTVVPEQAASIPLVDAGADFPSRAQAGIRWSHVGAGFEYSVSFFDGLNNLPNFATTTRVDAATSAVSLLVTRTYPAIRSYGGDAALPLPWLTLKGEAAYFTSSSAGTDEYVLYVVQVERQAGEWVLVGGYAGEAVTKQRAALEFAPDRGLTRSVVARASYTIDPSRSAAFEAVVRQNGDGVYAKAEYSQARGQHWRATISGVAIAGQSDDFLGQFHLNSHVKAALRYSF